MFQRQHMMQRLVGNDAIVRLVRLPFVEVAADRRDVRADALVSRVGAAAIEHRIVEIETLDDEIAAPPVEQGAREPHFGIAIARPEADNVLATIDVRRSSGTTRFNVGKKEPVGMGESERFELGPHVAVRPVVKNRRQRMDLGFFTKARNFRGNPRPVMQRTEPRRAAPQQRTAKQIDQLAEEET